jgi:hypothetical protein
MVETSVDAVTAAVEPAGNAISSAIEAVFDAVTPTVEVLSQPHLPSRLRPFTQTIEAIVNSVAAPFETVVDALASVIKPPVNPISQPMEEIAGSDGSHVQRFQQKDSARDE